MNNRDKLIRKIKEVIQFAEEIEEYTAVVVLSSLAGSLISVQDFKLAKKVQEFTKDVLIPELETLRTNEIARNN